MDVFSYSTAISDTYLRDTELCVGYKRTMELCSEAHQLHGRDDSVPHSPSDQPRMSILFRNRQAIDSAVTPSLQRHVMFHGFIISDALNLLARSLG